MSDSSAALSAGAGHASATWFAPGRVNVIGEHTDYNSGLCLPMAIAQGCTARVSRTSGPDPTVALSSVQEASPVSIAVADINPSEADGWTAYPLGVLWAMREQGFLSTIPSLEIVVDGNVPVGSGLSSSAALECSVAGAVSTLLGLDLSSSQLLTVTRQAENDYVGLPNGGLDQMASLMCEADSALLCDFADLHTTLVPLPLAAAGATLLVLDTNAPHQLTDGEYGKRRTTCEAAAAHLGVSSLREVSATDLPDALSRLSDDAERRAVRHVVTENTRVEQTVTLLRAGDIYGIGELLTASHVSLRDDYRVTVPELDVAQEALLDAGAAGARMTGGGFGGCVIALLATPLVETATLEVQRAFESAGFAAPSWFTALPGPGARAVS